MTSSLLSQIIDVIARSVNIFVFAGIFGTEMSDDAATAFERDGPQKP